LASPSQRNMAQLSWSPHQPAAERQQQPQLQLQLQQQYSSIRHDALPDWPATAPSSTPASSRRYLVHSPQADSNDATAAGMADSQWHPSHTPQQGSNPFPPPPGSGRLSLPAHLAPFQPGIGTGAGTSPHTPTRVLGLGGGSSAASAVSSARAHSRRETHHHEGAVAAASNRRMLPPVHSARQSSTLLAQFSTPANTHRRA
jgi:hypothetical protein